MRSQKQRNRAPRPFKTHQDQPGWNGGNRNDAFVPPPKGFSRGLKPIPPAKPKPEEEPPATTEEG